MIRISLILAAALLSTAAAAAGNPFEEYDYDGRRHLAEGQPDKAAVSFEEALRINPFDPVALNNLAVARLEAGDFHSAFDLLKRAARLAPTDTEIAANLSRLRGWLNSYADAGLPAPSSQISQAKPDSSLPPPPPPLWEPVRRR